MTEVAQANAGRIYDYLLGGTHNFEADRQAAEHLINLIPTARNGARLNRWFMYDVVQRLAGAGFKHYLDLATGLPTEGYLHDLVPEAKVLYNDFDPVTVAYGREIVGDNPNVHYVQSDIRQIDEILAGAAAHLRHGSAPVGICFVGAAYFFDDDTLRQILGRLHAWAPPASQLATSWISPPSTLDSRVQQALDLYKQMGVDLYQRTPQQIAGLLEGWTLLEPGIIPLNEWNQIDNWMEPADRALGGNMYGALVQRE